MSLISDNQRKTAKEPEAQPAPLPKPTRLQEYDLQPEFEQGQGALGFATEDQLQPPQPVVEEAPATMEEGTYVEFSAGSSAPTTGGEGLLTGLRGQLGQGAPEVPLPNVPAASTPPLTNLWKDATVDLGLPNLSDSRALATYPTLFANPLTAFDPGTSSTFAQGANASIVADAQARAEAQAAQARAIQSIQERRGALPNTPDASKPWHEQLWGWAGDVLQGDKKAQEEANAGKVDVLQGRFGKYGAGLGGYLKAAFGIPIAGATAIALETWGRDEYRMQRRLLRAGNPTVRTESADGRSSIEKPFKSLTPQEQHKYLTEVVSNRLPLNLGSQIKVNADFRRGFGSFLLDALSAQADDSVSDANPRLAPVTDKRTGKPAAVEAPKGFFYAANKRPGQTFFEDPGSAAIEILTQLASPGNKVDFAGEALGLGLRALSRTGAAKAAGRALVNAVPVPVKKAGQAVARAAKRTVSGVASGTFGSKPLAAISQPTPVVGLPKNTGIAYQNYLNNQVQLARGNSSAPTRPATAAEQQAARALVPDPEVEAGVQAWRKRHMYPPVVQGVPAFDPTLTPVLPKTDPEGLAAVVSIGQKGAPLAFEPTVGLRTHAELVQQVLSQNPEKFGTYKGSTWEEWDAWKKANLGEEDLRQLEAVGAVRATEQPTLIDSGTKLQDTPALPKQPTLDDLQTQARVLAEQKLSVEAPLKQLEDIFDETVDVGRRTLDEVPLRPLTPEDIEKAIDYEASLRLSRQLPTSIVEAAARGDYRSFLSQAEAYGGIPGLVQAHNQALTDLSSRITPEVVATSRLATDVPPVVYHGTALAQWQPYNVLETGSRGELGSALYTTRSYEEAAEYSRATVGNNRPTEIAYEPLSPQVVELDTSKLLAPLDARLTLDSTDDLVQAVVRNLPTNVQDNLGSLPPTLSFTDLTSRVEVAAAQAGGGEGLLRQVNDSVSDVLRQQGYDATYDPKSGWLAVVDNGKLNVVKQEYLSEPSAIQAAVARYNADSLAAGNFPEHVTSDANLRDSAYQVLDQARNQLDERLEEVQEALQEATYKEEPKSFVQEAAVTSYDTLRARAKEPPSVERYKRDIQEFGQPLHPVLVREFATGKFEVVGNREAYEAATAAYNPRTYSEVAVVVEGKGQELLPILSIRKKAVSQKSTASTKEEVLKEFNKKTPDYTSAPAVLEETAFGTYRILDRGYTANAYKQLKQKEVPAVVVGIDGKATQQFVPLSAIEKKPKALEPEVPKLEEAVTKANDITADAKPAAKTSADLRKLAKELKVDVSEVNFRSRTQREELQKLLEQKQSEPKFGQGLSPSRQAELQKRMQPQSASERLVEEIVVEPQPSFTTTSADFGELVAANDNYIPIADFRKALAETYGDELVDGLLIQMQRSDFIEPSLNDKGALAYVSIYGDTKVPQELVEQARALASEVEGFSATEAIKNNGLSSYLKSTSSEELLVLVGRFTDEDTASVADTALGSVVRNEVFAPVVDKAVADVTQAFEEAGLVVPKIEAIVFGYGVEDSPKLKAILKQNAEELNNYGGDYNPTLDAITVNLKVGGLDNVRNTLAHELAHAFDARITNEQRYLLEDFFRTAYANDYFPSHYGFAARQEFFAESFADLLLHKFDIGTNRVGGKRVSSELRESFLNILRQINYGAPGSMGYRQITPEFESLARRLKSQGEDVGEFGEALAANPHATLTEALDEVQAGRYDICNL